MEAPHMPEQSQQERIIVADDHPVFRDGLCRIAQRVFPQASILEAGDMDEVLNLAQGGAAPSLFMLDLLFPGQSPQAISALCQAFARSSIVVVSMVDNRELIEPLELCYQSLHACGMGVIAEGELLDFFGSHAASLRHESDGRLVEIGKDIYRRARQGERAIRHQHQRPDDDQEPVS